MLNFDNACAVSPGDVIVGLRDFFRTSSELELVPSLGAVALILVVVTPLIAGRRELPRPDGERRGPARPASRTRPLAVATASAATSALKPIVCRRQALGLNEAPNGGLSNLKLAANV